MITVPRLWPGATVVCLGTGPSLTAEDVATCRGRARRIAINDAYRLAPDADVLYGCDARWWGWHGGVPGFAGLKYALARKDTTFPADVQVLANTGESGLELDPSGLRTGRNSGYQAINLAVHLGATRILLLGYDMGQAPGQPSHFFGEHPTNQALPFALFLNQFPSIVAPLEARGVEVINCSRQTALTCFPRRALAEMLAVAA